MSARILTNTPISGESPEVHFGEHFKQSLWVEFVDNAYEKWNGCFECEYPKSFHEVLLDKENKTALVVSSGVGYLIDIENRKLLCKTEDQPAIESAVSTTNPDYLIAGTYCSVYVFDNEKLVKEVEAYELVDGIYFKIQVDRKVIGDLVSIDNPFDFHLDFEFDLDTFELIVDKSKIQEKYDTERKLKEIEKDSVTKKNIFRRLIDKIKKVCC
jgi:hypothetical protein